MDREIDRWIGAVAAVMRSMYRSVVVKKELSRKAKLSIYQSLYVPTLTYGHELWVMTERSDFHSLVLLSICNSRRRGPGEAPGHAGETMSLGWPGNALGSLRKSWRKCLGRGRFFGSWMNACCKTQKCHGIPLPAIPVIRSQSASQLEKLTHLAMPPVDLLCVGQSSFDGAPALASAFDQNPW
ncbi:hypothetical protein QTP86_023363 [Hemibagrus guttatus]|nr:hypothetical protein QTP86_023363 [Hemibagrus guttatus]